DSGGRVVRISRIYETEPMEVPNQPWFLNCVIEVETELPPAELLHRLLEIERSMGRRRTQNKGPRNIDIDVVLYAREALNSPGLTVPHPAMHARRFVLAPLAEIAPDAFHPVFMRSAASLLADLPAKSGVIRPWTPTSATGQMP